MDVLQCLNLRVARFSAQCATGILAEMTCVRSFVPRTRSLKQCLGLFYGHLRLVEENFSLNDLMLRRPSSLTSLLRLRFTFELIAFYASD